MLSIGIDVSKSKLDIFYLEKLYTIANSEKDIKKFFINICKNSKIVFEATGKYHRLLQNQLSNLGFKPMVINPFQSRHFAKALNVICKTDAVDAKILCLYAEKMKYKATPCPKAYELEIQELSRHLDDLKKIKLDLEARLREADGHIAKSLKRAIKAINKEIKEIEEKIKHIVDKEEALSKNCELLESIPGIGRMTAIMLLSYLRELGNLSKNEIAALSGLAPRNNDSGVFRGKRYVRGGRVNVRAKLYMPILGAATMHNNRLKSFYSKLLLAGKDKKVALTACMRKVVIWANSILSTGKKWDENLV